MEKAEVEGRKTRKRSKSDGPARDSPVEPESAPDLNGEDANEKSKDKEVIEPNTQSMDTELASDANALLETLEDNVRGRKRKASELKDDDLLQDKDNSKELSCTEPENKSDLKEESSANDSSTDSKDIKLPPKQTLGKGKRARIPNKRYGDILVPHEKQSKSKISLANGDTQSAMETPPSKEVAQAESDTVNSDLNLTKDDSLNALKSPAVSSIKGSRTSQTGSPSSAKKQKLAVDLTNPNYLKPFLYGWKRELVYRATSDVNNKRMGDIYYYTPSGKKVRSMREVSENLKNKELTLEDFTFFKEPIGLNDSDKEIIREAKYKAVSLPKQKSPKTPKVSSPKSNSTSNILSNVSSPTPTKNSKGGGFKIRLSGRVKEKKGDKKADTSMDVASWSPPTKKSTSKWSGSNLNNMDNKPCQPCSIRCEGVSGLIPTLQCRLCLCLYHYECVGLSPHTSIQGYVCKNCQLGPDMNTGSSPAPPPLTPINTLKSMATQSSVLPKLQRIPKSGEKFSSSLKIKTDLSKTELPHLTPRPGILTTVPKFIKVPDSSNSQIENKSLVGGVTTWFPPSSTIQLGDQTKTAESGPVQAVRPQFVEYLGDRKFIIIPKHNFLSVSPTIAATASARSEENVNTSEFTNLERTNDENEINQPSTPDSAKLGNDNAETQQKETNDVKVEPESPSKEDGSSEYVKTVEAVEQQTVEISAASVPSDPSSSVVPELQVTEKQQLSPVKTVEQDGAGTPDEQEFSNASTKRKAARASSSNSEKTSENKFSDYFLQNVAYGYKSLLYIFQYLKVQDLLRAGCVCTMWKDLASHPILWKTVRMKNSQVHSFEGLANTLEKHGTVHLDLRKMLLPSGGDEIWPSFSQAIKKVESLRKIELCRCPAIVVQQLAESNPQLEVINAVTIKCEVMDLSPFVNLKNLQELRLKSTAGLTLNSDLTALKELTLIKHLSLTSVKDLNKLNIDVIAELHNLESLELGECTDFSKTFGPNILVHLHKLEKLRLEKGQGTCYTFEILDAVKSMPRLEQLELVNFDIKTGFDKALGACTNIKKLLIIPTYISQSATTNHMVLGGVLRLQSTLSHFVWGVTLELLRVTELFVDQCEEPEKKEKKEKKPTNSGDSIPVLKPVPLLSENVNDIPPAHEPPQVEILPLPNLQKLLLQSLPTTRVKILKIPFHATWRQSITDTVN